MSRWTPSHSVLLSMLLDDVIGTQEMIEIRKDKCRITDCVISARLGSKHYLTGSKAEGLDLPGSDDDIMIEINLDRYKEIEVVEQEPSVPEPCRHIFLMVTDNVHPGFTMLRSVTPTTDIVLLNTFQEIDGFHFLSSYLLVCTALSLHKGPCKSIKIQGPSLEHTTLDQDTVNCIHCSFWPSGASEWVCRARSYGWPSLNLINKIVDFGFHLVPTGYPRSAMNMMEWRISFSIAEKYLVWSFNHTQMQMYAVLKLIQKEYIKVNCSTENYVLCSYFIKTFLFWKFEGTDKHFWRPENFRDCLKYLLTEFHTTIQLGTLKHYFIPTFNLLEVKLTRHAQIELLQLWDIVIQYDIKIIEQCQTLKQVWREFANRGKYLEISQNYVSPNKYALYELSKKYFVKNTEYIMRVLGAVKFFVKDLQNNLAYDRLIESFTSYPDPANADFVSLLVKQICLVYIAKRYKRLPESNKSVYALIRLYNTCSPDIASGKLLCAILFFTKGDYSTALITINKLLSSIPPYDFYKVCEDTNCHVDNDAKILYADMFVNSKLGIARIARRSWLLQFHLPESAMLVMPLAIQSSHREVQLSPLTLASYLQFLCYHGLRQYDNRDRALRQLVEVVDNPELSGCDCIRYLEYYLAGHCLGFVGERARAREMFIKSYMYESKRVTGE